MNVLPAASEAEARAFATTAPHAEKWEGVPATERSGVPVLDDALVWVVCELRDLLDGGDHTIVTGTSSSWARPTATRSSSSTASTDRL